jgi:hypothetical protein
MRSPTVGGNPRFAAGDRVCGNRTRAPSAGPQLASATIMGDCLAGPCSDLFSAVTSKSCHTLGHSFFSACSFPVNKSIYRLAKLLANSKQESRSWFFFSLFMTWRFVSTCLARAPACRSHSILFANSRLILSRISAQSPPCRVQSWRESSADSDFR